MQRKASDESSNPKITKLKDLLKAFEHTTQGYGYETAHPEITEAVSVILNYTKGFPDADREDRPERREALLKAVELLVIPDRGGLDDAKAQSAVSITRANDVSEFKTAIAAAQLWDHGMHGNVEALRNFQTQSSEVQAAAFRIGMKTLNDGLIAVLDELDVDPRSLTEGLSRHNVRQGRIAAFATGIATATAIIAGGAMATRPETPVTQSNATALTMAAPKPSTKERICALRERVAQGAPGR